VLLLPLLLTILPIYVLLLLLTLPVYLLLLLLWGAPCLLLRLLTCVHCHHSAEPGAVLSRDEGHKPLQQVQGGGAPQLLHNALHEGPHITRLPEAAAVGRKDGWG
jgi:hypothetical protein